MNFYNDLEFVNFFHSRNVASSCRNHVFDGYYGIQFILRGAFEISIDGSPMEQTEGPLVFFTSPEHRFSYGSPDGTSRDHLYVCFRGERAKRYAESGFFPVSDISYHPLVRSAETTEKFKELFRALAVPGETHHARAVQLLEELLLFLTSGPETSEQIPEWHAEKFRRLMNRIVSDPGKEMNFSTESREQGLSLVHFRRMFTKIAGMPPGRFLLESRLRLARNLLTSGELRVNEVAERCGFGDVFHFSRQFKKQTGFSPADFRKSYRGS